MMRLVISCILFIVSGSLFLLMSLFPASTGTSSNLIHAGLGFSCIFAGILIAVAIARNKKKRTRLKTEGISYNAEVVRAYYNTKININGKHPIVIECTYADKYGKTYLLKSDNIYNAPISDISVSITEGITVTAWVNPSNPKDYYVDVKFADILDIQEKNYDYDLR